ncbi:uncharacterized protein [Centruroides vittatus]|uniref:uncharacterized protein isoform X1 n=2 Tax=Centruroides vittatus TaxID=120091 RepID=UPI00350F5C09
MMWFLCFLLTFSGLNCDPHSELVADIYHNAPPIIKAALINVGLAPRKNTVTSVVMKQLPSPPIRLSSPLTLSNFRKSHRYTHRNLRPHTFPKVFMGSTRVPPQRVQQLPPLSLPQLPTTSYPRRRKHPRTTYASKYYRDNFKPLTSSPEMKNALAIQETSIENLVVSFRNVNCKGEKNWCELDATYPEEDVGKIVKLCESYLDKMYAPMPLIVPTSFDMKRKEDNFSSIDLNSRLSGQNYWKSSLCHAEKRYFRPSYARDINGRWQIVLQSSKYPQRISLELCKNEGNRCNKMADCIINSRCVQKYSYQMLVSIDPKKPNTCPSMRLYSFPTACVCLTDYTVSNL